jgi:isoleucyl-tRNA synthetase
MSVDYKATVNLPRTDFPMKARLPEREPELLARWERMELFRRLRQDAEGREKFILHDGPPYANGNIHIGTAMNKILKDVVNRSQQMMGKDADYVPGWDCHGLPIEWKIEEKYRAEGRDKDRVPIIEFRHECREFAEHWIDVQREEFKRLGVEGDWDDPYTTMTHAAEAQIVREILKFLVGGALYKGSKAVLWSVVEKTALAEAEVEYHDHTSTTIYVRFPIQRAAATALEGASVVIWTTTPWTIPGNRALACHGDADYLLVEVAAAAAGSLAIPGERLLLARDLVMQAAAEIGFTPKLLDVVVSGRELAGTLCRHPFQGQGYEFEVPLLTAGFVTMDQGTGFVHIAPGHGADDFELGVAHGLEVPQTVDEDGTFFPHVPLFAGKHVFKVNGEVADRLEQAGRLLARGTLVHSYPHSWRSKAPLIFRNAPQWFISMSETGLRETALAAIDQVRWVPPQGRNRIYGMIESRPDWVISRQRAWGVPIPVFVDKRSGEPLRDEAVNQRIVEAVAAEGADAWFASPPSRFLGADRDPDDYDQVEDILDVWFESGATHSFVLEDRPNLRWPASLYLEGSDQHRGWFHSSLLEACGTRGRAPYDTVLTHGFVMDGEGRKMSKSLGNTVAPQQVVDQYGADILRLWVVSTDYSEDMRIGPEIIKAQVDAYRRLRNTLRFLLGNLADFDAEERLPYDQMPEIERWVLHRLTELDTLVRRCCHDFDFHALYVALHNFCTVDLSAFYFDMRKDSLYCDRVDSPRRRAARTVLDELFSCLTAWLAPILCFTAEEAWLRRFPGADESVHLRQFPEPPPQWRDDGLVAKWQTIRRLRRVVTGALEVERQAKRIGSSLQAHPEVYAGADYLAALDGQSLAEIAITSGVTLTEEAAPEGAFALEDVPGVGVVPGLADGARCERCWQVLSEVGERPAAPDLCRRCVDAVENAPG